MQKSVTTSRRFIGRLQRGEDLLAALTERCRAAGIRLGRLEAIGAVEVARVGFYDQDGRIYRYLDFDTPQEILSLKGNVSLRDGEVMVHAHITLGDAEGRAGGGHLAPGTRVFACEYLIEELAGAELHRSVDEVTGLPLWPAEGQGAEKA